MRHGQAPHPPEDLDRTDRLAPRQTRRGRNRPPRPRRRSAEPTLESRGNRSDEGPVLKPLVRELLEGRLAPYVERYTVEQGGGAYLVQVP